MVCELSADIGPNMQNPTAEKNSTPSCTEATERTVKSLVVAQKRRTNGGLS
jgi:hypothetical protein